MSKLYVNTITPNGDAAVTVSGSSGSNYGLYVSGSVLITENLVVSGTLDAHVQDFKVTANTMTFGDASGDTLTYNAATSTYPNGLTIDSAAAVNIDSDTGDVVFKDGGTDQLAIDMDGTAGQIDIQLKVDADDLVFKQYDGNEVIRVADDRKLYFYDQGGEHISSNGTDMTIGSGNDLNLTATTDINIPANVGLTFGDDGEKIEGDGTDLTISSSNDLTLDAGDDVILDSYAGKIRILRNETMTNMISFTSADGSTMIFDNQVSNANYKFKGSDGGSGITALEIDIADAGTAKFNNDIKLESDSAVLNFGADSEISLTHNADSGLTMEANGVTAVPVFELKNTNADATGATFKFTKDGSSPATSDVVGNIDFASEDAGNAATTYARIQSSIVDVTAGGEQGGLSFLVAEYDGTLTEGLAIDGLGSDGDITVDVTTHDGSAGGLMLAGTLVTSTAAELNIMDGGTGASSVTLATSDKMVINDGGTMKQVTLSTLNTFISSESTASAVAADDISAGDAAVSLATSSGNVTVDSNAGTVTVDGHTGVTVTSSNSGEVDITSAANVDINATTTLTIDSAGAGSIDFAGDASNITLTTDGAAEDFTISLAGATDSSLILSSTGTAADALQISTSAGGMDITVAGAAAGEDLDITAASSVNITSTEDATDSVKITGYGIQISGNDRNDSIDIKTSPLELDQITAPDTTTDKLYNVGGTLTWNGTALGQGGSDPASADGDSLGTASAEWSDLYLADGGIVYFGNDQEITLTHEADVGLILEHTAATAQTPIKLTLKSEEDNVTNGDVIGALDFKGGDSHGGDALLVCAGIEAIATASHTSTLNQAKLGFKTAYSEVATVKMELSHDGNLSLLTDGAKIAFGADEEITLTHSADIGLVVGNTNTGDNKPVILTLEAGENVVADAEVLGALNFKGSDNQGGDSIEVCAGIEAVATADHTNLVNKTKLSFKTATSEAAAEKMNLDETGHLSLVTDSVAIKFGADSDVTLTHVADYGLTLEQDSDATQEPVFTLKSTGDLASGPMIHFLLDNGAGEADDEVLGTIKFSGDDSGDAETIFATIEALSSDITNGDEGGQIKFSVMAGGTAGTASLTNALSIGGEDQANTTACEVVVNDGGGGVVDFRVETTGEDEALFIDASANALYINKGETAFETHIYSTNDVAMSVTAAGVVFNEDSNNTNDFRIESDSESHFLFVDAGLSRMSIGDSTDNPAAVVEITNANSGLTALGLLQLNHNDVDTIAIDVNAANTTADVFDITADGVTTALVMDITADALTTGGIINAISDSSTTNARTLVNVKNDNTAAVGATLLAITNDAVASTAGQTVLIETTVASETNPLLNLKNSNADAAGPILRFTQDGGSAGANSDVAGTISFYADDADQNNQEFVSIIASVSDATAGGEEGKLEVNIAESDGTMTPGLVLMGSSTDGEIDCVISAGTKSLTKVAGNLGVGVGTNTGSFQAAAVNQISILNGTSPGALTADQIYIGAKDSSGSGTDTKSTLALFLEEAVDGTALDAVGTLTTRIPIWVNDVEYWLYLDPV